MNNKFSTATQESLFLFFYVLILFFGCSKFSPLYSFNYWADINIYFTIGKGIWFDKVIYKDLFDHKGPLIFFIYGIGYLISNTSFLGMFIIQVLVQFIGLYFSYLTLKLFLNRNLSLILALLVPLFVLVYNGNGGAAEEFIFVFQVISFYYFLHYFKKDNAEHPPKYMFIHGIMFSFAFYIKFNLVILWFFPIILIQLFILYKQLYSNFIANVLNFISGFLLITLPLLIYFYFNNALIDFWNSYFQFNFIYGELKISSVKDYVLGITVQIIREIIGHYIIYSFIILGILFFVFSSVLKLKIGRLIILLSSVTSIFVIVSTRVLLDYYLVPFLVFSLTGCICFGLLLEKKISADIRKPFFMIAFLVCILIGFYQKSFFGLSFSNLYTRDFPPTEVEFFQPQLQKVENPTLLVTGFKKGIPVFSKYNIVPNTRFFFFPNIHHETYPTIRDEQTRYIKEGLTDFVILYETFRYYEYYKQVLEGNYSIQSKFEDGIGGVTYLYKKN